MTDLLKDKSPKVTILVGSLIFVLGASIVAVTMYRDPSPDNSGVFGLMLALCGAVLAAYSLNIADRQRLIQTEVGKLSDRILQLGEKNELGLVELAGDASIYDYTDIIAQPKTLTIVLNHGQTWVSVHIERLRKRFADPTKETTFFVIHPESPLVPIVARKGNTEPSVILAKLRETISLLREIKGPQSRVNIYGHFLYNTYSACIGDKEAVVTAYFLSRGARTVPVFRFADVGSECVFRELVDDIKKLKLDSAYIGPSEFEALEQQPENVIPILKSV
jgi:hypothetical protein